MMAKEEDQKYYGVCEVIKIPTGVYERKKKYLYQCPAWLFIHYTILKKSTVKIAEENSTNHKNILYWLNKYQIERRTLMEALKGRVISEEWKMKISSSLKGENNPNWKGGIRKDGDSYIRIHNPEHPYATKDGYVRHHRYILEQHLNRFLIPEERVHHINGIKNDNRIENLMLFPNESEHQKFHQNNIGN